MIRILGLCVLAVLLLESCNIGPVSGGETEYPLQKKILRIDLTPDTVATRDTMLIHCLIEDSTDTRFKYYWGLGAKNIIQVNGMITGAYIKFVAPNFTIPIDSVVIVTGGVAVDDGASDSLSPSASFDIPVIKK
jgi:hypothetical protein